MSHQSYREQSRLNWGKDSIHGGPTEEQIHLGAILRIADATEKMAQRHIELIRDRDNYLHWYKEEQAANERLRRQLAAAKGQITKLRKLLPAPKETMQ